MAIVIARGTSQTTLESENNMRRLLWIFVLLLSVPSVMAIGVADGLPDFGDVPPHAHALVYGESLLSDDWRLFFIFEDEFQVNVAWQNEDGAVIVITRVAFVSDFQRDTYINEMDNHLEVILENYSPYTIIAQCSDNRINLYEIDGFNDEFSLDYRVNFYFWIPSNGLELWTVSLNFPDYLQDELLPTSSLFQPDFVSCESDD